MASHPALHRSWREHGVAVRERIVAAVAAEYRATGAPPRIRIIGALVGLRSSNTTQAHLRRLVAEGKLRQPRPRGGYIPNTPPGVCPMCGRPKEAP